MSRARFEHDSIISGIGQAVFDDRVSCRLLGWSRCSLWRSGLV